VIILTDEDIRAIFSDKLIAASWLERNGNKLDREVAAVTRQTLENVITQIIEKNSKNWLASSLTRETLEGVYALQVAA
jgi:hypothetical protein